MANINPNSIVSLREAVAPLGELRKVDGYYHFVNPVTGWEWDSFQRHAKLVQVLTGGEDYLPVVQLLLKMSLHQKTQYLFPNVKYLEWTTFSERGLEGAYLFIPPSLTSLSLQFRAFPNVGFHHLKKYLTDRVRILHYLEINFRGTTQLEPQSHDLLASLLQSYAQTLTSVCISTAFNSTRVASTLSRLPNLQKLRVGLSGGLIDLPALRDCVAYYTPSSLEFLVDAERTSSHHHLVTSREFVFLGTSQTFDNVYLHPSFNFARITSFSWGLKTAVEDFPLLIRKLRAACSQLQKLKLGDSKMFSKEKEVPVVPWSAIQPLLEFPNLTSLSIHPVKIDMSPTELRFLCKSRRTWEVFEVFPAEPVDLLEMFENIIHCQNLSKLGVFIDIFDDDDKETDLQVPRNFPMFPNLSELDIAYSGVEEGCETMIGEFLYNSSFEPIFVVGWNVYACDAIKRTIAALYMHKEKTTGSRLSPSVQEYIKAGREQYELQKEADMVTYSSDEEDSVETENDYYMGDHCKAPNRS